MMAKLSRTDNSYFLQAWKLTTIKTEMRVVSLEIISRLDQPENFKPVHKVLMEEKCWNLVMQM